MRDRIRSVVAPRPRRGVVAGGVVLAMLSAIAGFLATPPAGEPVEPARLADDARQRAITRAPAVASTSPAESLRAPATADVVADAALLATPEVQAHFARERFNARARAFFADAAALAPAARAREARELDTAIDGYERSRELSAGEAMMLRLGLVDASGASAAERAERMAAIVARYDSDGRQREARWLARQAGDAAFGRYKAREPVVVAEVMAMTRIPEGLSRDEYLRRRLEAERVAAMQ